MPTPNLRTANGRRQSSRYRAARRLDNQSENPPSGLHSPSKHHFGSLGCGECQSRPTYDAKPSVDRGYRTRSAAERSKSVRDMLFFHQVFSHTSEVVPTSIGRGKQDELECE